jgi:hypothetical protein
MREFKVKPADEALNRIIQREKKEKAGLTPSYKVKAAQETSSVNLENNTVFIFHGLE